MGCKNTNANEEEFFRFLIGIHFSKGAEGIEGNVQIALATTRKKKYERVANNLETPVEEDQNTSEST